MRKIQRCAENEQKDGKIEKIQTDSKNLIFSTHHCWQTSFAERAGDKWFSRKRHFNRTWQHKTYTQWWNTTTDRTTLAQMQSKRKINKKHQIFSYYISCCIPMTSHTTRILYNTCFEYWKSSTYKLIGSFLFSECHVSFHAGCRSRQLRMHEIKFSSSISFFSHFVHVPLSFPFYFNEVILFTI